MRKILGVRFREVGKISYFVYEGEEDISFGDKVIAETKRGVECGKVVLIKTDFPSEEGILPSEKIVRKATDEDLESLLSKREEEKQAEIICKQKIAEHNLKMKLIDVEYMFDRSKLIFYFVSESRIDFRNLVKELARIFKIRIELRQMGIRDEAKILGGLGFCGKPLCCSTFLNDFQHVNIKMAKDQNMSLNPVKLSGACGRLMCCIKYEHDAYRDVINNMPFMESRVLTPQGYGLVKGYDILKSKVKVALENDDESVSPKVFDLNEIT